MLFGNSRGVDDFILLGIREGRGFFLNRFLAFLHIPELLETEAEGEDTEGATDDTTNHTYLLLVRVLLEPNVHATELHVVHKLLRFTDGDEVANSIEALHEEGDAKAGEDEVELLAVVHSYLPATILKSLR